MSLLFLCNATHAQKISASQSVGTDLMKSFFSHVKVVQKGFSVEQKQAFEKIKREMDATLKLKNDPKIQEQLASFYTEIRELDSDDREAVEAVINKYPVIKIAQDTQNYREFIYGIAQVLAERTGATTEASVAFAHELGILLLAFTK